MKPASFQYHSPSSLEEALDLLAEHGDEAKALAGGQSLVPAMNFRLAQPQVLVDLNGVGELDYLREVDGPGGCGALRLGAMTRQRRVERDPLVARKAPLVAETLPFIAHPQIRNRGTFGGSLAHADPAAELPAVALALQARFRIARRGGQRTLEADDFFTGLFETALEPDELLVEVQLDGAQAHSGSAFVEVSRRHGDYALVGVACAVRLEGGNVRDGSRCESVRVALLSVGEGPVLATNAVSALIGEVPGEQLVKDVARVVGEEEIDPPGDIHASKAFRRHLATVLTERALTTAFDRAGDFV